MSITYNYEIISVNESANSMEIIYTADGYPTQHIGARLPYEGETVEGIVEMFSPVAMWLEQNITKVVPEVNTSGVITPKEVVEDKATIIRMERDAKLNDSDKYALKFLESGAAVPAEWKLYRQALRDVTLQNGFPDTIEWPVSPYTGAAQI